MSDKPKRLAPHDVEADVVDRGYLLRRAPAERSLRVSLAQMFNADERTTFDSRLATPGGQHRYLSCGKSQERASVIRADAHRHRPCLIDVDFIRDDRAILSSINWTVRRNERWVVLDPNRSGKTTLCHLESLYLHASHGTIDVLGRRLGQTDVRELRTHIGLTSAAIANMLRPNLRVTDVVVTGKNAALAPYWHSYTKVDRSKAMGLLARFGCESLVAAEFGTLSSGER